MKNLHSRANTLFGLTFSTWAPSLLSASLLLLTACGGGNSQVLGSKPDTGGKSGGGNPWVAGVYEASGKFAQQCEVPRRGRSEWTGLAYPDKKGTRTDEKNFLRSWTHETYLWFDEVVDRSPAMDSQTPQDYFMLLKTERKTTSGSLKDNFHFYEPTDEAEAWQAGVTYDYGFHLKVYSTLPPRQFYIAYVEPNSPAAQAGVARGDRILTVDSYSLVDDDTASGLIALNEGLFPSALGAAHNFTLEAVDGTVKAVSLQSAQVETQPVHFTSLLDTDSGKVGYLVFNTHVEKAQDEMVTAITAFSQAGVNDLILDLRYNSGGLLAIASQVAYMVSGEHVRDKVFYKQIQNAKQPPSTPFPFLDYGLYGLNRNLDLPSLQLERVYILSTEATCSASEAIINGLRGAGVDVYLFGDTTCGKPYGFYPKDNCGTTYYTIQIKGANALGYGDYSEGFEPSFFDDARALVKGCKVADDLHYALGDETEPLLATALYYRSHSQCPSTTLRGQQKTRAAVSDGELMVPDTKKLLLLPQH